MAKEEKLSDQLKDNSWKRYFYIKWLICKAYFNLYLPISFFFFVNYAGSFIGRKMFNLYVNPSLDKLIREENLN